MQQFFYAILVAILTAILPDFAELLERITGLFGGSG